MPGRRDLFRLLGTGMVTMAAAPTLLAHHNPDHDGGPPDSSSTTTTRPTDPGWRSVFFEPFAGTALDESVWAYDHPLTNYGDAGGQNLDSVFLSERVSVHDGAVWLEAVREDWDTRQVSATSTPRIAHYTAGSIVTHDAYFAPGQRIEYGVATDLNFRPCFWTSAPQSGDDSEMDFEFFSVDDTCHIGQIWDYTPLQKDQYVPHTSSMPNPKQLQRYACWRRDDGVNIYTINDLEVYRQQNRMSDNPQRIRLSHQVGGRWDGGYLSDTGSGGTLDPAGYAVSQVRWVQVTEPA